jgi:MFS family permease
VVISLVFLSPLVGYTASALLNNSIHLKFGQRGVAIVSICYQTTFSLNTDIEFQLAPSCHLLAYVVIAVHPPYPVLVVIFMVAGFGNGLADAAWNAWIGNMANPNEVLGFLHAFYGLGAVLAPLIATTMITKGQKLPWYYFYYVMVCLLLPCMISLANDISDRHGRDRTRNVNNSLLARNRRRLPCRQPTHQ